MTGEDGTAVNHHILAGTTTQTSVLILAALDADAIVAGIELRIDDECVLTRLQIQRIAILGIEGIASQHVVEDDVLAHQRMEVPGRRVLEDDTLQEHILAVDQRHHDRTQEALDTVPLFVSLSLGHVHVGTLLSIGISLIGHPVAFLRLYTTGT